MGAVDYVPVPVVPEVLRAKVKVFAELYRKTRELEQLNPGAGTSRRGADRGVGVLDHAAAAERGAPQPGAGCRPDGILGLGPVNGDFIWDDGQYRIFGVDSGSFDSPSTTSRR